ncbi:hypothetical protein [Lapillicoccus sp.]|uniref:hypothetical protein n=1 Tax=Lapillicoccus sp. TaxID=1909287 RepID=UPI0032634A20
MKLPLSRRRDHAVPAAIVAVLGDLKRDRVLSGAGDADSRAWLVASSYTISFVDPGQDAGDELVWSRPWHLVDAGSWSREASTLTLTWVDKAAPAQLRLGDGLGEREFLQTLRERVQASVVQTEELALSGRRTGRAVIRQDLRTGELLEQVVLGRGVREDDEVRFAADRALTSLREQVGMPHP